MRAQRVARGLTTSLLGAPEVRQQLFDGLLYLGELCNERRTIHDRVGLNFNG